MGRIKELREKQAKEGLNEAEEKELKELVAEAKSDDEEVDSDADKLLSAIDQKYAEREKNILSKLDEAMNKLDKKVDIDTPKFIQDSRLGKKTVDELSEMKVELPNRDGKKFKEVSMKSMHFVQAVITEDRQKIQVLVGGTDNLGGYLIPDDYADVLIEDIRDQTVMRQLAEVMTTTSDTLHVPTLASRPKAFWRAEAAVKQTSTAEFGEIVLTPYSIASIVTLSNELVADARLGVSPSIVSKVGQLQARAISEREDRSFWTGDGSSQPTGIDNYSFTTITAGLTDTSRADAVIQAFHRLPQGYRNRAVYVANGRTLERLHTLKDSNNNYLVSDLAGSPTPVLRGRPVYEQNDIGDGKLFFGDFSYYVIADREGIRMDVSEEATVGGYSAFERNLTHVRVEKRTDGELTLTQPVIEVTGLGAP